MKGTLHFLIVCDLLNASHCSYVCLTIAFACVCIAISRQLSPGRSRRTTRGGAGRGAPGGAAAVARRSRADEEARSEGAGVWTG